ncbi:PilC/PilY family type IV pilus protein [Diaphorobacter sp. LR2014-1]|uniref:pilus assembly protein n=1 Tax=Diaphorobacter sp. LR2014-1 TaxID=1933219 RepID=UPI000CDAD4C1|nr:PilC/PilY family type IV pilus protein [Diaphorobacter sp. LR2014-1]POR11790.1 hypothetical protein BV908_05730 [Diaphorobacter sp. LR2014-1]
MTTALPPHLRQAFMAAIGMAVSLLLAPNASAQMLTQPLQVGGGGVPPNMVFTLDDSGSMWWECLPDSLCTNGSNALEAIPKRDAVSTANRQGTAVYDDVNVVASKKTSWTASANLLSRQMRSSAYNPLYYNPTIQYKPWLKGDGTRYPNAPTNAAPVLAGAAPTQNLEGVQTVTSNWCISLTTCYNGDQTAHLARYYTMTGTGSKTTDFTLVKIESGNNAYPKAEGRTDCTGPNCTYMEEIQNFANWYTYYRTRALTAIGGTAEAFAAVPKNYRVGYGRINTSSASLIDGVSTTTLESGVRGFSDANKTAFYDWLAKRTQPSGGTPLRQAMDDVGKYFSRADNRGPWGADPGTDDKTAHASCRRSIHLLMTDGMWNGAAASTSGATQNVDGTKGPTINGPAGSGQTYTYSPMPPYKDSSSNTLADVAMYYWNRDLRTDLENTVKPITVAGRENPAFWQHMVNFTIAFGVNGTLNNPGDLDALSSGSKSWPSPGTSGGTSAAVDDLWHAAINSRGRALSARNSQEYAAAIKSILDDIAAMSGSEAGVGLSTTELPATGSSTKMYVPFFSTPGWSGDIKAISIDQNGKETGIAWTASSVLPSYGNRNIYTYDPEAAATKGVPFRWISLSSNMKTALWGSTTGGEALVDYLRGSSSGEGSVYRQRKTPLGDIVNSTPALVHDLVNSYYDYLPPISGGTDYGAETYRRFIKTKQLRSGQLVVGANDGMLHMFNETSGVESFAFMPRSLLGVVKQLANTDYTHRYYVDGPAYESDVYDRSAARWRNLVQGFGGAGGKYLYTIRMPTADWISGDTPPATLSDTASAPGAGDILWEVNDQTTGFSEMGYVLSKPETGVTRDGTWVTIFGNGYESASGKAQLFIVNALTGALIKVIDTGAGSTTAPNGLGGVGVVRDGQQRIVAAYAGDLQGNLWKFDLSSTNPTGDWKVAFAGKPLFKATNADGKPEPITAKPGFRAFPKGGVMVLFGTGKLFDQKDQTDNDKRTMYGIWDKVTIGSGPGTAADALADSALLVTQNVETTPMPGSNVYVYRKINITSVDYKEKRGWRLPLIIGSGERVVDDPQILYDRILMQTVTLSNISDSCQAALMVRRGYMLDPFMSSSTPPPFDANIDGTMDSHIVDLEGTGANKVVMQTPVDKQRTAVIIGAEATGGIKVNLGADAIRRQWRSLVSPPK